MIERPPPSWRRTTKTTTSEQQLRFRLASSIRSSLGHCDFPSATEVVAAAPLCFHHLHPQPPRGLIMSIYTAAKASFVYKVPLLSSLTPMFLCDLGPPWVLASAYLRYVLHHQKLFSPEKILPPKKCCPSKRLSVTIWTNNSSLSQFHSVWKVTKVSFSNNMIQKKIR